MTDPVITPAVTNHATTGVRRWPWLLAASLSFIAVTGWLLTTKDSIDIEQRASTPALPVVSIETVEVTPATVTVQAFAELKPRWSTEIRAGVGGRITEVTEAALAGSPVNKGTELVRLEDSTYRAELAQAELNLADAHRQLLRAESETAVARRQYRNRGDDQANALALKLPELQVAKQAVTAAEARLAAARVQLAETRISTPFAGIVTRRLVSPGQRVSVGDALIELADNRTLELTAELSRQDWQLLAQPITNHIARLSDSRGKPLGQAKIRQGGGFLDNSSRQYLLFLQVDNAHHSPLLAGDFVQISLPGIRVDQALNLPASAITQNGKVWHLDANNQLRMFTPDILFRRQQRVVIRAPEGALQWRIATTPLAAFLPGQQVQPRAGQED